jgi:hypothetical protein
MCRGAGVLGGAGAGADADPVAVPEWPGAVSDTAPCDTAISAAAANEAAQVERRTKRPNINPPESVRMYRFVPSGGFEDARPPRKGDRAS